VSIGVLTTNADAQLLATSSIVSSVPASAVAADSTATGGQTDRSDIVSRSASRLLEKKKRERQQERREARQEARAEAATAQAIKQADTTLWTTTELNLWKDSEGNAKRTGLLDGMEKVLVTGREADGRIEVVVGKQARWVNAGYLAAEKPEVGPTLGGGCTNGSSISAGHAALYDVHDAVCSNWPEITSYGTWRGDGEHGQGRAIDIMVSGETGWDVANFLRENYSALGIEYIIYAQHIWSVERGGEGWRGMSDRGSTTANHYDHVHVTVW